MAQQMYYYFYLKISAMDELFDPDKCPKEYLVFLSSLVGWKLIGADPDSWRQQIKHAPLLYKIKGTEKSVVIAEKLIGYSVFMTELYRDYTGAIVPKERLFNTFPLKVKIKPWFRKTSVDTEKHIFTDAFSDLFPSFNEGTSDINSLGELLHPKSLRRTSTRYTIMSSQPGYDPKTGVYSLARLAKLPRINLILKKDRDLDYVGDTGVSVDATASEALDLLLKFKPFHVYINNLVIMYSLTDYLFGSALAIPGDGSMAGDAIIARESFGIVGSVDIGGENERISYRFNTASWWSDIPSSSDDVSINKGNILVKYETISYTSLYDNNFITDTDYLTSLGFSLKGYTRALDIDKPNRIWNNETDFVPSGSATIWNRDPLLPAAARIDKYVGKYSPLDYTPAINASFISVPFRAPNITRLRDFIPASLNADSVTTIIPTESSVFMRDAVYIGYTKNNTSYSSVQSYVNGNAWSLEGIKKFHAVFPSLVKLSTGDILNTTSKLLNELYNQGMLAVVSYSSNSYSFLLQESDYKLDSLNQTVVINTYNILTKLEQYFSLTPSPYLPRLTLHLLYIEKEPITETFNIDSITRGTNISSRRSHKKFTRYQFVDTTITNTLQHTQSIEKSYALNSAGVIEEDFDTVRGYNTELPVLFTRKSLFEEQRSGAPVLSINSREPRNETLWTLLKPSPDSYIGAYPVITDFFANYYNLDLYTTPLDTIKYLDIDMSPEVQIESRSSDKWKSLVSKVSPVQKEYFLVTRNNDFNRTSKWNRGSALKSSRPFIGASRAHVQPFRNDLTSFTRKDFLKDYATSTVVNYPQLGNYAYTSSNKDVTFSYFSIGGNGLLPAPHTNEFSYTPEASKTLISNDGTITYSVPSINISEYDSPMASLQRDRYYSNSTSSIPLFSMYAGNIRFDTAPLSGNLFTTLFDSVDVDIGGLQYHNLILSGLDLASREIILDYNTYIVWREINTGATVNIGLAPDVPYSIVRPNIRLLHNGIELSAGPSWTISDTPVRLILDPGVVIEDTDSFNIEYQTLGSSIHDDPRFIPQVGLTSVTNETTVILTVDNNYLKVINFNFPPVVEWTDGATYCGWSEATNNTTNTVSPFPLINQTTAIPNVSIIYSHGTSDILVYGIDWQFRAIPAPVSYRIQLSQKITDQLSPGNQIMVTYKHR
jgi:hypothetical protein